MNSEEYTFDDITPISLENDTNDGIILCKIMYDEEFKTVFGYLRRLMKNNELSKRAMFVACEAIKLVPAHYTVWEYKYRIVEELVRTSEYTLKEELDWCADIAINNEKNYQIWHYRENIIRLMIDTQLNGDRTKYNLDDEYNVTAKMLDSDEKNYHVWSHKRWIVQYFCKFRSVQELNFTEKLINQDVRNNSAWNFRYFVLFGDNSRDIEDLKNEIDFTTKRIDESITNPSSWNYMKFLYNECKVNKPDLAESIINLVYNYSKNIPYDRLDMNKHRVSVPAFELLCDIYNTQGEIEKQKEVFRLLGTKLDPVRRNYWAFRANQLDRILMH